MRRLIVTDLDGTLLRSDRSVSEYSLRILNAAIASGLGVTYATGRSQHTAAPLVAGVPFRLPAIVFNGALVVDPRDGTRLLENVLDREIAVEVAAAGGRRGLPPFVFGVSGGREVAVHAEPVNEGQRLWLEQRRRAGDRRLTPVPVVRPPETVLVVQFTAPADHVRDLAEWVRERFGERVATSWTHDVYVPGYGHYEVYHPRATKREMLRWVAEQVGVGLGDVTAIGDNLNDLPMFEVAGRRLAVGNACPEVLAAADEVLHGNDEDGVARYVERLLAQAG